MEETIRQWVFSALRPGILPPAQPEFLDDRDLWKAAWDSAARLGAELPLAVTLRSLPWFEEMPESARLRVDERLARARMLLAVLDDEAGEALSVLVQAKIPVAVTGPFGLGHRFYADRLARPVEAADLLVPVDSMLEALRSLGRAGYRATSQQPAGSAADRLEMAREPGRGVVRLQRYLTVGDTPEIIGEAWQRTRDRAFGALPPPVRAIHAEDHFVQCIREIGASGNPGAPVSLNDLHVLLASDEFRSEADWDRVLWALARCRSVAAAWVALRVLSQAWGTAVPSEATSALDRELGPMRARALGRLARAETWFPAGASGSSGPPSEKGFRRLALRLLQRV